MVSFISHVLGDARISRIRSDVWATYVYPIHINNTTTPKSKTGK